VCHGTLVCCEISEVSVKFHNLEIYYKEFKDIFTDFHARLTNIEDDLHVPLSSIHVIIKKMFKTYQSQV
jgi:hypothetical protein